MRTDGESALFSLHFVSSLRPFTTAREDSLGVISSCSSRCALQHSHVRNHIHILAQLCLDLGVLEQVAQLRLIDCWEYTRRLYHGYLLKLIVRHESEERGCYHSIVDSSPIPLHLSLLCFTHSLRSSASARLRDQYDQRESRPTDRTTTSLMPFTRVTTKLYTNTGA